MQAPSAKTLRGHGLTPEAFETLYRSQNGCCAICGISEAELEKKYSASDWESDRTLHIDYEIGTKPHRVRGLLCCVCYYEFEACISKMRARWPGKRRIFSEPRRDPRFANYLNETGKNLRVYQDEYVFRMLEQPRLSKKKLDHLLRERRVIAQAKILRVRQELLIKFDYTCQLCKGRFDSNSLCIDHYLPIMWGGSDDIRNLWVLCKPCNSAKKDRPKCPRCKRVWRNCGCLRTSEEAARREERRYLRWLKQRFLDDAERLCQLCGFAMAIHWGSYEHEHPRVDLCPSVYRDNHFYLMSKKQADVSFFASIEFGPLQSARGLIRRSAKDEAWDAAAKEDALKLVGDIANGKVTEVEVIVAMTRLEEMGVEDPRELFAEVAQLVGSDVVRAVFAGELAVT